MLFLLYSVMIKKFLDFKLFFASFTEKKNAHFEG